MAVDPRVCAPVQKTPAMPKGANIVQPATREEADAVGLFLAWVADLVDVATENEGRANLSANTACR